MSQDRHYQRAMQRAQARGETAAAGFSLTLAFLVAGVLIILMLLLL